MFFFPLLPLALSNQHHRHKTQCRNSANPTPRFFTLRPFFINLGTDPGRSGLFEFLDLRKMKSETTFYKTDILSPNLRHWQQMSSFGEELQFPIFLWTKIFIISKRKRLYEPCEHFWKERYHPYFCKTSYRPVNASRLGSKLFAAQ